MANKRVFGEIFGISEGATFTSYAELNQAKLHTPTQAGISGSQTDGADSIVISGGYEDDEDFGYEVIYTGHGGRDANGKQIADQTLTRGNMALARNELDGLPVRVIRGANKHSPFAPATGYRYDGLYRVESHWAERGRAGFNVYRYKLVKLNDSLPSKIAEPKTAPGPDNVDGSQSPRRVSLVVQRVIRDSKLGQKIKTIYNYRCQVCDLQITTEAGLYAEAAHIKPVGAPHNGPDLIENLLCLCPNHHLMFDKGVFIISDELNLHGISGDLNVASQHIISKEFLNYHRLMFSKYTQ